MTRKKTAIADAPQESGAVNTPTVPSEPPAEPQPETIKPPEPQQDNGEKKYPAFKVGPIPTGRGESVAGCVWENEHQGADGRTYMVHSIVLEASYYNERLKKWMPSTGIKPSQLAAVEYVLRCCGDFAFRRRDPQAEIPF